MEYSEKSPYSGILKHFQAFSKASLARDAYLPSGTVFPQDMEVSNAAARYNALFISVLLCTMRQLPMIPVRRPA